MKKYRNIRNVEIESLNNRNYVLNYV